MGLEALGNIGEVLSAAGDSREEVVLFSPSPRPSPRGRGSIMGVQQWRDLVNVRYAEDGYREDVFLRGGTELVKDLAGNDIVQMVPFSVQVAGVATEYIAVKKVDGFFLYDVDGDSATAYFGAAFDGGHRVWMEVVGRFLFVFDPTNRAYRYLDLKGLTEHTWLGASSPNVLSADWITLGDFEEGNVWGFRKGGRVICLDQTFERVVLDLDTVETLSGGSQTYYRYKYNGGKYITIDGTDYKADAFLSFEKPETVTYGGTGTEAVLERFVIKAQQDGAIDFSPHLATLNDIEPTTSTPAAATAQFWTPDNAPGGAGNVTVTYPLNKAVQEVVTIPYLGTDSIEDVVTKVVAGINGDLDVEITADPFNSNTQVGFTEKRTGSEFNGNVVGVDYPADGVLKQVTMSGGTSGGALLTVTQEYDTPVTSQVDAAETLILPRSTDVMRVLEYSGKYVRSEHSVDEAEQFQMPVLSRGYVCLYELVDGSYTIPGTPQIVTIPANELLDGSEILVRGVELTLSAGTPPTDAVQLHLFATKWQLREEHCFAPREAYPNGPFYHASAHEPGVVTIEDFTEDDALLDPLSAYLPMVSGIFNVLGEGQSEPYTLMSAGTVLGFGGYTLNRPSTLARHVLIQGSGGTTADLHIGVVYEYTDKSLSDFIVGPLAEVENEVRLFGLNGIVAAVHVYLRDTSAGTDYYHVRSVRPTNPEWYGLPFEVSDEVSDYEAVDDPAGDAANESVDLSGYVALATPPNALRIDNQFNLSGVKVIRALIDSGLDDDRGTAVRRRFTVLTDRHPVMGLISTGNDGRFLVDSAAGNLNAPVTNGFAAHALGGTVFYPGPAGLYVMERNSVRLFVPEDRYPVLGNEMLDLVFHERRGELWILTEGNKGISVPLREDLQEAPMVTEIEWPTTDARAGKALAVIGNRLFAGFDARIYETDVEGALTDAIHTSGSAPLVTGSLTSDHLGPWDVQLYLKYIEAFGEGYEAEVLADLQAGRFDEGGPWTKAFQQDVTTDPYALSMRGGERAIEGRGISPRLRVVLEAAGSGRFSGLKLVYEVVEGRR